MGKNVAVFVDVANIFYAAKAAGVDIDYVTLLKAGSAGRDLVRAYAYTGLDPENENQRNFHDFLRRHGYRVVSKDIRKYGDGKVKANLDIELVVDMMKTARNLDVAIVVSGDGDFAPAIRAVQEMGVRVEVVSFRGNTSSDLMDVADQFTDITQIAKVEKGSSRSGRRVAGDEADLSMTEVPEKQSEGTGERSRGRGRSRRAAEPAASRSGRGRSRPAAATDEPTLVVLPGEKLSRAAGAPDAAGSEGDAGAELEPAALAGADEAEVDGAEGTMDDGGRRRRRRRGGRGRGRGRGREDGYPEAIESAGVDGEDDAGADDGELDLPPARPRPASTFGSVWDSQIGIPAAGRTAPGAIPPDEEDLDEPEIPEYLLTERRRRQGGRGRGGRGSAYAAALERERYGGGRGGGISRYVEPPRGRESGGVRREPAPPRGGRPAPRGTGDEPWSEVPPEIEAMLRAQLGPVPARTPRAAAVAPSLADEAAADGAPSAKVEKPSRRATSGRKRTVAKAASDSAVDADEVEVPATKTTTRRRSTRTTKAATKSADEAEATAASTDKPKRTTRSRKPAAAKDAAASPETADAADEPKTPRRRTTRKKADPAT